MAECLLNKLVVVERVSKVFIFLLYLLHDHRINVLGLHVLLDGRESLTKLFNLQRIGNSILLNSVGHGFIPLVPKFGLGLLHVDLVKQEFF